MLINQAKQATAASISTSTAAVAAVAMAIPSQSFSDASKGFGWTPPCDDESAIARVEAMVLTSGAKTMREAHKKNYYSSLIQRCFLPHEDGK